MATTQKGINYPDNYSAVADIPADMQDLAESVDATLDGYQEKVSGKGLSTNDFTNADKEKLEGIEAEANKTIVDNALNPSSTNPVQNKKVYEALEGKVDKVTGKGLSEEDYTSTEKTKLAGIEDQANKTIVDDELDDTSTNPVQNKVLKEIIDAQASEITALKERDALIISQIPTGTASGISIDLDDSSNLEFDEFEVKGRSTQNTTEGISLVKIDNSTKVGVTYTNNDDGSIKLNGSNTGEMTFFKNITLPAGTYYLNYGYKSGNITTEQTSYFKILAYSGNTQLASNSIDNSNYTTNKNSSFTLAEETTVQIRVYTGSSERSFNNYIFNFMLTKTSSSYNWEPYTNGASPNPSYPQTIYSAGDNSSITEEIVNANWFDGQLTRASISVGSAIRLRSTNQIDVIPNEDFTLSLDSAYTIQAIIYEYDENDERTQKTSNWNNIPYTFKTNSTTKKIRFVLRKNNDNTLLIEEVSNVQLQKGSNVLPYVAHLEQNISIPCQQPMRSIGTVKDEFVKVNGTWYERHNILRLILKGTESWARDSNYSRYYFTLEDRPASDRSCLCNYLITASTQTTDNAVNLGATQMFIKISDITTTVDFKAYLAEQYANETPVYVDYILNTPTDLPCTAEQITALEVLKNAHTYKNITHIYSNDTTPAYVDTVYRKDLTTMFNKLDNLEARVALLED